MWGQATKILFDKHKIGIIPTRVGTSNLSDFVNVISRDHPHACGDKQPENNGYVPDEGSSPRVWGQALHGLEKSLCKRIIPTRVGTSAASAASIRSSQDHPHACGDKYIRSVAVNIG